MLFKDLIELNEQDLNEGLFKTLGGMATTGALAASLFHAANRMPEITNAPKKADYSSIDLSANGPSAYGLSKTSKYQTPDLSKAPEVKKHSGALSFKKEIEKPKSSSTASEIAKKMIISEEGFIPKVYKDPGGVQTIGHGLTANAFNKPSEFYFYVKNGMTKEQSEQIISGIISNIEKEIDAKVKGLNDNQKAALIDFGYNVGQGGYFQAILKKLNDGKVLEAMQTIKERTRDRNGKEHAGLIQRRNKEISMFLGIPNLPNKKLSTQELTSLMKKAR